MEDMTRSMINLERNDLCMILSFLQIIGTLERRDDMAQKTEKMQIL